ncbi:unnamed protein product [Chrysoparadoxa australica]
MRLITHNLLKCNVKGVAQDGGFPLIIEAQEIRNTEQEMDPEFILSMLPKLEWQALRDGAKALGLGDEWDLPEEVTEEMKSDEDFLRKVHHCLLEVTVVEGALICPDTGRRFPILNAIPNMLLHEHEL